MAESEEMVLTQLSQYEDMEDVEIAQLLSLNPIYDNVSISGEHGDCVRYVRVLHQATGIRECDFGI